MRRWAPRAWKLHCHRLAPGLQEQEEEAQDLLRRGACSRGIVIVSPCTARHSCLAQRILPLHSASHCHRHRNWHRLHLPPRGRERGGLSLFAFRGGPSPGFDPGATDEHLHRGTEPDIGHRDRQVQVNKPYLPLASGDYSLATGVALVIASALSSLGVGFLVKSRPLLWALSVSFVLGTAYSIQLPFLRWKRSAVAAASCILSVRAIVVQLAFFLHMQAFVLKRPAFYPRSLLFATAFMCFFSVVIALFKDIPDVEGDQTFGIQSFSVRLGQEKVFWLCIGLLEAAYASAVIFGAMSSCLWSKIAMTVGHSVIAAILWMRSQSVDLSSKAAISSFYMFVWKLFYAEYFLIPFMR
ncbi:probable homogentisate phytyltransferase 1, chloroplastic isoform X2 [Selaginella moellendorffii]|uniref:probable homogentisate phytyltransferase 1, chloroplastic isoform X2 n=1 Tax=Selaginella moellendorffii TaxID=88036 RepID=UPI000D1C2179|nr:probable homogentisate phytyltransferase 1, chloroplastic isoform X2 [Selaginella moellendorffii]|eukprot:XP_024515186.1 probable homogentisate phytyltransferase 1, chloroplastic isoform X2 [Selaginella moellendorffii]